MQISKRDYFAAAALTGLLARSSAGPAQGLDARPNVAAEAFLYADEMMKLSKTLLDPVEFDPDQLGEEEKNQQRKKEKK